MVDDDAEEQLAIQKRSKFLHHYITQKINKLM
jgi:hypothetical protein